MNESINIIIIIIVFLMISFSTSSDVATFRRQRDLTACEVTRNHSEDHLSPELLLFIDSIVVYSWANISILSLRHWLSSLISTVDLPRAFRDQYEFKKKIDQ